MSDVEDLNSQERQEIVDACFQGLMPRDCDTCPLSPTNGGRCCFGEKYDIRDAGCVNQCIHRDDCRELSLESAPATTWRYQRPRPVSRSYTSSSYRQPVSVRSAATPAVARVSAGTEQQSGWERFGKDTVWGALEGLWKAGYDFFRTRRWD